MMIDKTKHVLDSIFLDLDLLNDETINDAIENVKAVFYKIKKLLDEADLNFTLDNPHKSNFFIHDWEKTRIALHIAISATRDDDSDDRPNHCLYIAVSLTDADAPYHRNDGFREIEDVLDMNELIAVVYNPLEQGWQCWISQINNQKIRDILQTIPDLNFIRQVHEIGSRAVIDENTAIEIIRKLIEYWQKNE